MRIYEIIWEDGTAGALFMTLKAAKHSLKHCDHAVIGKKKGKVIPRYVFN